jgi:hypothetical protein
MTGTMLEFAFRESGAYRLRLTYNRGAAHAGKTSKDADQVEVRFVKLIRMSESDEQSPSEATIQRRSLARCE